MDFDSTRYRIQVPVDAPVTEIMSTPVHAIGIDQHLSDARRLMTRERIHHVLIVEGRRLVGMVSASDIMRLGYGDTPDANAPLAKVMDSSHSLREVMQRELVTIGHVQSIRKAAELLSSGSFHALPVVDGEGAALGMVTSTDLVRYLARMF